MSISITNSSLIQMQMRLLDNASPQTPARSLSSVSSLSKWNTGDQLFTGGRRSESTVTPIADKYDATDGTMPSLLAAAQQQIDRLGT